MKALSKINHFRNDAFQRIATLRQIRSRLAMTNQLLLVTNTAEVQSTRMVTITHYQPLALQWAVGCFPTATSERRHIRLRADYHYFALRGASIRRSRWDNARPPNIHSFFSSAIYPTKHLLRHFPQHKRNGSIAVPFSSHFVFACPSCLFARTLLATCSPIPPRHRPTLCELLCPCHSTCNCRVCRRILHRDELPQDRHT